MTKTQKQILISAGVILAVYLGMKYVLRLTAPFFAAWILVRLLNPLAEKLHQKISLKKEWITLGLLGSFLGLLALGCYFLVTALFRQFQRFLANFDSYQAAFGHLMDGWVLTIEQTFHISMDETLAFLEENLSGLTQKITVSVVPNLFSNSQQWILYLLKGVGILFLVFLAVTMLMRDYDDIRDKLARFPLFQHLSAITGRIFRLGGTWLKSQFTILCIVTVICVIGLWLSGNSYALLLGILIGVLDALPFLGTGIILLPWALFCCLTRDFFHAACYATLFLVANSTREFLEPKLLGDKLGVYPIVIALVVYVGICIYGPTGVFLGPLTLLIITEVLGEFAIFPRRSSPEKN